MWGGEIQAVPRKGFGSTDFVQRDINGQNLFDMGVFIDEKSEKSCM